MPAIWITALLSFGLLGGLSPLMTFATVLPTVAVEWGLSAEQSGWLGGIYFAGYAAAVLFLTAATDRIDARIIYGTSAALGGLSSLLFALAADGFALALVLRFVGGIAVAGVHMPGLKLLLEYVRGPAQARSAAVYTSVYAAGSAFSYFLAGAMSAWFDWRTAFLAAGVGPLVGLILLLLLPPKPTSSAPLARSRSTLAGVLRNRTLVGYAIAFAGNTWEVFAIRTWFVACLAWSLTQPGQGLSLPALGIVSGLAALAGVPVSMLVAEIAHRLGYRPVIIAVCALSVANCLGIAAAAGGPATLMLALLATLQIVSFADVAALSSGAATSLSDLQRGAGLAIYGFAGFTSGFIGPVAVGFAIDAAGGTGSTDGWSAGFLLMALGSTVTALAMVLTRPKR
jgi:MFS family permease